MHKNNWEINCKVKTVITLLQKILQKQKHKQCIRKKLPVHSDRAIFIGSAQ